MSLSLQELQEQYEKLTDLNEATTLHVSQVHDTIQLLNETLEKSLSLYGMNLPEWEIEGNYKLSMDCQRIGILVNACEELHQILVVKVFF